MSIWIKNDHKKYMKIYLNIKIINKNALYQINKYTRILESDGYACSRSPGGLATAEWREFENDPFLAQTGIYSVKILSQFVSVYCIQ